MLSLVLDNMTNYTMQARFVEVTSWFRNFKEAILIVQWTNEKWHYVVLKMYYKTYKRSDVGSFYIKKC